MKFKKTFLVSTKNQKQVMCVCTHTGMYKKGKKKPGICLYFSYIYFHVINTLILKYTLSGFCFSLFSFSLLFLCLYFPFLSLKNIPVRFCYSSLPCSSHAAPRHTLDQTHFHSASTTLKWISLSCDIATYHVQCGFLGN